MADKPPRKPLAGLKPQDWRALGIGLELAAVIGGSAWLGSWADGKLGTAPWIAFAGVVFGICGGGWHALKMSNGGKLPEIPGITKPTPKKTTKPGHDTLGQDDTPDDTTR